jgi:glycosyltransferase involved in cell wall biosynthesis
VTRVSVALATFNGEAYLEALLHSLTQQTLLPAELLVGDDGSHDETVAIVEEFARSSPFPVRLHVNGAPSGFAENFLATAVRAESPLVAFCDQDDVWHEDKLRRCSAAFSQDVALVVHNSVVVDDDLKPAGRVFPGIRRRSVAPPLTSDKWFHMPGMAMVFRRELLEIADWRERPRSHSVDDGACFHDEWIHVLAQVCGSIVFLPDELVLYRQHEANVTGAPGGGGATELMLNVAGTYYRRRAEQSRQWEKLLDSAARHQQDKALSERLVRGSVFFGRVSSGLQSRAAVHESASRRPRLVALALAVKHRAYGSRREGGSGLRGLARDVVLIVLGRGTEEGSTA